MNKYKVWHYSPVNHTTIVADSPYNAAEVYIANRSINPSLKIYVRDESDRVTRFLVRQIVCQEGE